MNIITYPYSGEARHVYSLLTAFITVRVKICEGSVWPLFRP